MISWNATSEEISLITGIVDRYINEYHPDIDRTYLQLDIKATHLNGCELDLAKFLHLPKFDFIHDVCGITKNINRVTGKLDNFFLPRCAKPSKSENQERHDKKEGMFGFNYKGNEEDLK